MTASELHCFHSSYSIILWYSDYLLDSQRTSMTRYKELWEGWFFLASGENRADSSIANNVKWFG